MGRGVCGSSLHFQENTLAVEEVEEKPADGDVGCFGEERLRVLGHEGDESVEEPLRCVGEVDEPLTQIDGDGVHADDREEERPPDAMDKARRVPSEHLPDRPSASGFQS